jgi:hypothetical protein
MARLIAMGERAGLRLTVVKSDAEHSAIRRRLRFWQINLP